MQSPVEAARIPEVIARDLIGTNVDEAGAIAGAMAGPHASRLDAASVEALAGGRLGADGAGAGAEGWPYVERRKAYAGTGGRSHDDAGSGDGFAVGEGRGGLSGGFSGSWDAQGTDFPGARSGAC
ncbi:MAG: hypothetical protein H0X38_04175 [Planctomycetes bacterium]|nr:hypothetical protein [Planctomycetota bacterium]